MTPSTLTAPTTGHCGGNRTRAGLRSPSGAGQNSDQKRAPALTAWNLEYRLLAYALGAYEMGGFTQ